MDIKEFIDIIISKTLNSQVKWERVDNDSFRLVIATVTIMVSIFENKTLSRNTAYKVAILEGTNCVYERKTQSPVHTNNDIDSRIKDLYNTVDKAKQEELNKELSRIYELMGLKQM